jgi:hypothetical protein
MLFHETVRKNYIAEISESFFSRQIMELMVIFSIIGSLGLLMALAEGTRWGHHLVDK